MRLGGGKEDRVATDRMNDLRFSGRYQVHIPAIACRSLPNLAFLMKILPLLCLLSLPIFAADWPRFRGPTGDGIAPDTTVPLKWSAVPSAKLLMVPGRARWN